MVMRAPIAVKDVFFRSGNIVALEPLGPAACERAGDALKRPIITQTEADMQDRESQRDVNSGNVDRHLDEGPVEREGLQRGGVEREGMQEDEGLRGGPVTERGRADGGQITQREVFDSPGQAGWEDAMNSSRSGGMENRPGDRSDPMPPAGGSSR
jgi:hypothetical protein